MHPSFRKTAAFSPSAETSTNARPAFRRLLPPATQPAGVQSQVDQLFYHIIKPLEGKGVYTHTPIINGVLLHGPPGTGKTLLVAHAVSKSMTPCLVLKASEIHNKFYGESEKILATTFAEAKACAPAVILIDEIDCVFPSRSEASASHMALLSQLLCELDGVTNKRVALIATSNCKLSIDPALLRRLPVQIEVPIPGFAARLDIIVRHLAYLKEQRRVKNDITEAQARSLAMKTSGGSDLVTALDQAVLRLAQQVYSAQVPPGQRRTNSLPPLRLRHIILPDHASGKLYNARGQKRSKARSTEP